MEAGKGVHICRNADYQKKHCEGQEREDRMTEPLCMFQNDTGICLPAMQPCYLFRSDNCFTPRITQRDYSNLERMCGEKESDE